MRYLVVTHIPFAFDKDGSVLIDRLWAEDLIGLASAAGPIQIAAPCVDADQLRAWGVGLATLPKDSPLTLLPLPSRKGRLDVLYPIQVRKALKEAVSNADLVHTSNLFGTDTALYYAHNLATKRGIKTLFVVAEDFVDMQQWEWVRTAPNPLQQKRRRSTLRRLDAQVRKCIANASLTFLHTPAAVARYRLDAANAIAIRQPVHEAADVISPQQMEQKLKELSNPSIPLQLATASRLQPLKGLEMLVRAVAILRSRHIPVQVRLYGQGPQQQQLQDLIASLNLSDAVQLAGPLSPGQQLRTALAASHLFLMPHLTTDFGRAFFDAMTAASPVIAFRSPASEDTVRHELDGLLVANADPEALASAIERIHNDRTLAVHLAQGARSRALQNTRSIWNQLRMSWISELFR